MPMKKITLSTVLLLLSVIAFAQESGELKTETTKEYTRYFFSYKNSLPTLFTYKECNLKYYLEKYKKSEGTAISENYNLILQTSGNLSKSYNKDIYVTIVFENYQIINARPTMESKDFFNGSITIPILNMERLATIPIKSIIIKHNTDDTTDIIFTNQAEGIKTLLKDAKKIKETI
jgi:hypothetical protein